MGDRFENVAIAAIEVLAMGDCPLKQRLSTAWNDHLSQLHSMELPQDIQKRFTAMLKSVPADELTLDAIDRLTSKEAQMLAQRIVHFALDIEMMKGAKSR